MVCRLWINSTSIRRSPHGQICTEPRCIASYLSVQYCHCTPWGDMQPLSPNIGFVQKLWPQNTFSKSNFPCCKHLWQFGMCGNSTTASPLETICSKVPRNSSKESSSNCTLPSNLTQRSASFILSCDVTPWHSFPMMTLFLQLEPTVDHWEFQDPTRWRYRFHIRPIYKAYAREYPHKIWPVRWGSLKTKRRRASSNLELRNKKCATRWCPPVVSVALKNP